VWTSRLLVLAVGVAVVATATQAAPAATPGAARDVTTFGRALEETHPNLFRHLSRAHFRTEVGGLARRAGRVGGNELLVGLMRIGALPGPRNGHTGLFPLDPAHRRVLHVYPLRLYDFADGVFVVGELGDHGLVGARLVSVEGIPTARLLERVRPLVPRDNASGLRGWAPHYALVAEVLDGLGVEGGTGARAFTFERNGGEHLTLSLAPVRGDEYARAFGDSLHGHYPALLPRASRAGRRSPVSEALWTRTLAGGRALYVGYDSVTVETSRVAARIVRFARRPGPRRVIVDVRANGGGDNTTYDSLLAALASPRVGGLGLFLLVGRATFSAAGNFAADVDRYTNAVLVGEPTGGGVNQYGDAISRALPVTGWNVRIATEYTRRGEPGDGRLAVEPDVRVAVTSADHFAGRDPVLERALGRP